MVSKKILGAAIAAALLSQGAFATINLGTDAGAVKFAKESLKSADVTSGYATLAGTGNIFDVTVPYGSGVSSGGHGYVRIDLVNAKFNAAVVAGDVTAANTSAVSIQQGGAIGDSYVIIDLTSSGMTQTGVMTLAIPSLKVSVAGNVGVNYSLYDTPSSAVNQTPANKLASNSYNPASPAQADAVAWVNAVSVAFVKADKIADVANDFLKFTGASTWENVGQVTLKIDTAALLASAAVAPSTVGAASTAVAALNQLVDLSAGKSKVTLTGDQSFGSFHLNGYVAPVPPATTGAHQFVSGVVGLNEAGATTASLVGTTYDVSVGVNGTSQVINAGSYSLATNFVALSGSQFAVVDSNGALGTITRNGTSIQVPYLTTFGDYNQRLVLVNRSAKDAAYKVSFTTEAGVTAAAGTAATGTLAAGKTTVIKATDLVALTGGTRTAATVNVSAVSANIDAATTTVNLSDKSTDTVKLQ